MAVSYQLTLPLACMEDRALSAIISSHKVLAIWEDLLEVLMYLVQTYLVHHPKSLSNSETSSGPITTDLDQEVDQDKAA